MQARQTQAASDHARLPEDRPGEGSEPVEGGGHEAAGATLAVAVEDPREPAVEGDPVAGSRPRPGAVAGAPVSSAQPAASAGWSRRLLANLDLIVIVPAVIIALALGAPAFGVLVGAGAWLLQRAAALADRRLIVRAAEPGSRLGLNFIDAFARIWLLAAGIVIAGAVGSNNDGLAAALVIFAAYSIAFAVRIARGREGGPS
jgi:hypothetical protein